MSDCVGGAAVDVLDVRAKVNQDQHEGAHDQRQEQGELAQALASPIADHFA
jgi:hypothetical protein